jgi:octopine/nopaline transport system substrate-binding protein
MIPALNAGKYDVMMDAVSITPEREKVIAFSIPYAATPAVFAVDKDSDVAKLAGTGSTITLKGDASDKPQVADLRKAMTGKTIGIQTATVYAKFIYDNFKDVETIKEYKTSAERDLDLAAGRIDAAFDDATYFTSAFKTSGNENLAFSGPEIAGSIWGPGEGLGLRQSDTDLKTIFDGAIKKAIADGTIEKLSQKWFGTSVVPK